MVFAKFTRPRPRLSIAIFLVLGAMIALAAPSAAENSATENSATSGLASMLAAEAPITIEIDEAAYLEISFTSKSILEPPGSSQPGYVASDLMTRTTWDPQVAGVSDPTTNPNNKLTPRMFGVVQATLAAGIMPLSRIGCVSGRAQNTSSDHPGGRACDFMFDYRTQFGVESGWRMANWLVANQAALGIKYVIWQGQIWNARSRPGPWTTYVSNAYGCPNPAVITGCHYDHVHVSVY